MKTFCENRFIADCIENFHLFTKTTQKSRQCAFQDENNKTKPFFGIHGTNFNFA
jgi:hypothetical protein